MKKYEVWGKRIECIIGLFLLVPPVLSVIAFTNCIFSTTYAGDFATMKYLGESWTSEFYMPSRNFRDNVLMGPAGAMSATPIYLGIMALVGAYLIKGGILSFFTKGE